VQIYINQLWLFHGFSSKIRQRLINIDMELGYNYLDTRYTGATFSAETDAQSGNTQDEDEEPSSN